MTRTFLLATRSVISIILDTEGPLFLHKRAIMYYPMIISVDFHQNLLGNLGQDVILHFFQFFCKGLLQQTRTIWVILRPSKDHTYVLS
jgi:hypothetical protein